LIIYARIILMLGALTFAVFALVSAGPHVTELESARFRVAIVFADASPTGQAKAQIALMKVAKKHCKGRGAAVSEGTLELNNAVSAKPGRKALELSEVYRCVPKT
jgi:hypothetical protein